MAMAQRTSFRAPKAVLIIGAATILLGGCFGRNFCDLEPVRYPVYTEPRHIFVDPIGYHYTDIVPYRIPTRSEPLRREPRPNYPINGPARAPGAATNQPVTPGRQTNASPFAPTAPVKPQAVLRPAGQRSPATQTYETPPTRTTTERAPAPQNAEPPASSAMTIEARPTIETRRGTSN